MAIITAILAIFEAIAEWFVTIVPTVLSIFWAEGALTILGALAVCGLAISVIFLVMGVIQKFLHFRG